jgi:hypothetical protein
LRKFGPMESVAYGRESKSRFLIRLAGADLSMTGRTFNPEDPPPHQHRPLHDRRTAHPQRFKSSTTVPAQTGEHRAAKEQSGHLGLSLATLFLLGMASPLGTAQSRAKPIKDRSVPSRLGGRCVKTHSAFIPMDGPEDHCDSLTWRSRSQAGM